MTAVTSLEQHLLSWAQGDPAREVISLLVGEIAAAGTRLAQLIARYETSSTGTTQPGGPVESVPPLVQMAQGIFEKAIRALPVSVFASAVGTEPLLIDRRERFAVVIDPLDGSSNLTTNLSIGSIFSILDSDGEDFHDMCPGSRLKASGFLFYGPQTRLLLSCGDGTHQFLLDPSSEQFYRLGEALRIPAERCEFAINTSNYRYWDSSVRHFIDDCLAGEDGVLGENFNMRWNASLVAEAFRILVQGGVFLYPGDSRPEYRDGRLRLLFEALPLAMLIEQAGGYATDGSQPITEIRLASLQARTPLIFGCRQRVMEVIDYISGSTLDSGHMPLFAHRSLLRN